MTAVCGGGTSSPQTGAAAVTIYSAGSIALLLESVGAPWLIPVIPLLGLAPLALATFCATDPPAQVALTSAEANALLQLTFDTDFFAGLGKARDLVVNAIWWDVCQCDATGPQDPPAAPAAPAGAPITVQPTSGLVVPCYEETFAAIAPAVNTGAQRVPALIPAGATEITRTVSWTASGSGFVGGYVQSIYTAPSGGSVLGTSSHFLDGASGTEVWSEPLPAGVGHMADTYAGNSGITFTATAHIAFTGNCRPSGGAGAVQVSTDPAVMQLLGQILTLVTLVQRQQVPFAYIAGTSHPGLTGQGHFAVQGLIGCRVQLTSLGSGVGQVDGDPDLVFGAGWFDWGSAAGSASRAFIASVDHLDFPPAAGQYTRIGYTLSPGVTATITELRREP